jgi:hypothetical protein
MIEGLVSASSGGADAHRRPQLGSKRIYDFQKLELIEISIPSADSTNAEAAFSDDGLAVDQARAHRPHCHAATICGKRVEKL